MKYPISQLISTGADLTELSSRMSSLSSEVYGVHSAISGCYGQGGVGNRASFAADNISRHSKKVQHLGEVASSAAKIYSDAENQLCTNVYALSGEVYEPKPVPVLSVTSERTVWDGAKSAFDVGEKIWKSVKAVGTIGLAVAGCVATWTATVATAGAATPLTLLSTTYTANTVFSNCADIYNLWAGDESQVGKVNVLKNGITDTAGDLSERLCGNRAIGELVGKSIYSAGDVYVNFHHAKNLFSATNGLIGKNDSKYNPLVDEDDQILNQLNDKLHLNLKDRITQNDTNFQTVVDAIKELPDACSIIPKLIKSPLKNWPSNYNLYIKDLKNINEVVSTVKLLKDVGETTADLTNVAVEGISDIIIATK